MGIEDSSGCIKIIRVTICGGIGVVQDTFTYMLNWTSDYGGEVGDAKTKTIRNHPTQSIGTLWSKPFRMVVCSIKRFCGC